VVIHNLNVEGIRFPPNKAQPVLIVDADTVLTFAVSQQRFKTVSARNR
jgi:hypothetical protein